MKFDRMRLARGAKLIADHLFKPIYDFGVQLGSGLDPENRPSDRAKFRVTIHTGQISGMQQFIYAPTANYPEDEHARPWCFPFVIPQPQDLINSQAKEAEGTVRFLLDEVSISFDQNGENVVMVAGYDGSGSEGKLDHNRVSRADIGISIVEKRQIPFSTDNPLYPERTVFYAKLTEAGLSGRDYRLNPFSFNNINAQLSPYATYALMIDADFLRYPKAPKTGDNHYTTLPSFMVSMVFTCDYTSRDSTGDEQNIPVNHYGSAALDQVTITKPAGGEQISASKIESAFDQIEGRLASRLWSGYSRQSDTPIVESFVKDSGLEVIAVPMWQNFGVFGRLTGSTVSLVPNKGSSVGDPTVCEAIIPIGYPFVVHHVVLVNNYSAGGAGLEIGLSPSYGKPPSSPTFVGEVGVALLTGIHGDHSAYQQVAYLSYTALSLPNHVVDRFSPQRGQKLVEGDYTHELIQVPIEVTASPGVGMKSVVAVDIAQGKPFFIGRGAGGRTEERSQVGDGSGGMKVPDTKGAEMFLVVRQSFKDSAGLDATTNANVDKNTVYAGVGGNMLYIIGKKTMVGGNEPVILGSV